MVSFMDKDRQWATGISSIVNFCHYKKYREAVEKEVFRLAGVQDPKFLAGIKYILEISEMEFLKLKNGEYDK